MSNKYNIRLSDQEIKMFRVWDKIDPIDSWEKEKLKLISKYE